MDPKNLQYTTVPLISQSVAVQYHTVQWEDHFNHLISTLKDFTVLNIQTDITLVTGNHKVPIHRIMLSCYSSYFKECLTNEIFNCYFVISDINESLLNILINFIYTGTASVPVASLNDWYKTTKLLHLDCIADSRRNHPSESLTYFTWPQYRETILHYFWQSRNDPRDCDVILVTDNFTQTLAHSCILSACSRYLLNIFLRHTQLNKKKPYVLILQNVKSEDLEAVLEFCYRGSISVLEENMNSVYDVAELLGIQDLCKRLSFVKPMIGKMSELQEPKYTSDVISRIKTVHCISQQTEQSIQLQNIFRNFLEYEHLVDITIVKDKQSFSAHIVVLSAFSMYFKRLAKFLQHNIKDAFVLVKDLRTQHIRAFLDYMYKGEAEFPGTTDVICDIMSEWIDFTLLSISESETCQILSNATPVIKEKTEIKELLEDHSSFNIYHPINGFSQNVQCQEQQQGQQQITNSIAVTDTFQQDANITNQESESMKLNIDLETKPTTTENIKSKEASQENVIAEKVKDVITTEEYSNSKTDFDNSLEVHEITKEEKSTKPYSCSKCPKIFKTETKLQSHMKVEHLVAGERPYSCEICNKRFAGRSTVIYHRRAHTGERPHACSTCGKTFMRPDALQQHMTSHTGERRHQCSVCNRKFASKHTLNKHVQSHKETTENTEKQGTSTCEVCHKDFPSEAQFSLHSHIHNGCKPLRCYVCHKSFRYQDSLTKHLGIHNTSTHVGQEESHSNVLSCMYAYVCSQPFEPAPELERAKENEQHTFGTENIVHNNEKILISDSLQQYNMPSAIITTNVCVTNENKTNLGIPTRRPYSITIDGNLCCNPESQSQSTSTNIMTDNVNINLPPPPIPPTFHHQNLDIHPIVSLAASHTHDQQTHPHIEMIGNPSIGPTPVPYAEQIPKPFLFIENNTHLSQDIARQKQNR
ncbi:hypothetical protein C0J52_18529 [Blattella germanica]|nr:hypothetical protein C0J52_18529 [Blattella germanica]